MRRIGCAAARLRALLAAGPRSPVVCGKGPSLDPTVADRDDLAVLTLNHACRVVRPHLACFVDLEAFNDCLGRLNEVGCDVVLPWVPNQGFKPYKPLDRIVLAGEWPALARLVEAGRLYAYNRRGLPPARRGLAELALKFFSAEAAFGLAALAGAKVVYSTGVDGGVGYARWFDGKDRLANGRKSFDDQIKPIEELLAGRGVRWTPLPKPEGGA